jgi:TolB-like protein
MADRSGRVYRFGRFSLDIDDHSLKRDGAPVQLTPKLFELLATLVENAGRLVDKESLLEKVWPDVAVEEGNLTKGVFTLRQVLGQDEQTRYIETVSKRGYRFVAPLQDARSPTAEPPVLPDSPLPDMAPAENSIAVMPFSDMSPAHDHEFFCDGMSEEIINAHGRVPELRVASYTSSARFKKVTMDPASIGKELNVVWLLEGSVRKAGDMVRISVQLLRAGDGFSAWSSRFDRRLDDIFLVQD